MRRSNAMTIGRHSQRARVLIKLLRTYKDARIPLHASQSNYRLFGEETIRVCLDTSVWQARGKEPGVCLPFSGEAAAHLGREMAYQVRLYRGRESRTMGRRAYEHEHA